MQYYPVFLKLAGKDCLVVGAGQVGRRKIAGLLAADPNRVRVVDPAPPAADMAELLEDPRLEYAQREFQDADLDGVFMVIACTDSEELNWHISRSCAGRGIPCNIVDQPEKCSFIVPAVFRQGDLTLAISTAGTSPALARKIRTELDEYFGAQYAAFLVLMARLRPMVLGLGRGSDANSAIFRALVESELLDALRAGDGETARRILAQLLPAELQSETEELLHGLV